MEQYVDIGSGKSDSFPVGVGLHQGYPCPTLAVWKLCGPFGFIVHGPATLTVEDEDYPLQNWGHGTLLEKGWVLTPGLEESAIPGGGAQVFWRLIQEWGSYGEEAV